MGGPGGQGERARGRHPQGRSARTGCLAPGCGLQFWAASTHADAPRNEILHSWGGEGGGVQEVSWGAGTPSWSLCFPQRRQEGEEGLAGRPRVSWSERQRGRGWGAGHPPTPRFPGTWAVSVDHTRAPPQRPGRTWGAFLGLLVGTCGPQSTSRPRPWGQALPGPAGPWSRDKETSSTGAGLLLRPGVPTGVAFLPPTTTGPAPWLGKGPEPRGLGLVSLLQPVAGERESEVTWNIQN